jgi:hypothetical protein
MAIANKTYSTDNGRTIRSDTTVLEPTPKLFSMEDRFHVVFAVGTGTLQHQKLSKQLVRVCDTISGVIT